LKLRLLSALACLECHGELRCSASATDAEGDIVTGTLRCDCGCFYPVEDGIPRFVPRNNYATSFGFQWQRFRREQLDSYNGTNLSRKRLLSETQWDLSALSGSWLLDVGCGAGRFLDVLADCDADVVGVDLSEAIDAAQENLRHRPNVHLVQASIYALPFRAGAFRGVHCLGVLQHTPDPLRGLSELPKLIEPDGHLAVTVYERRRITSLNGKYILRPLTKRLPQRWLLWLVRACMPVLFGITSVLFRIPIAGRGFRFVIPVANWVELDELTTAQRYQWAVLDTFDALSPEHDHPLTESELMSVLSAAGMTAVRRVRTDGLTVVARARSHGH
jgi:SAM-dependent methyltransferase